MSAKHLEIDLLEINPEILFVIPPIRRFLGESSNPFPLGLGYMVSYLKKRSIKALIYNSDYCFHKTISSNVDFADNWSLFYSNVNDTEHEIWNDVKFVLKKTKPKIIGISSKVVDIPSTFVYANLIKEILPEAIVVVGGPSAITCSEYLMENKSIDYLVLGEGEETITELSCHILNKQGRRPLDDINGICYRKDDGSLFYAPQRELIANIDDIPFPDREALFVVDEQKKIVRMNLCVDILTSRGCPYRCTFCCTYEAWNSRKPRLRSVDNVVEEIRYLKEKFGQSYFIFWDDLFTYDRKRTIELCKRIINEKLNITWLCLVRINTIDKELLKIMKQAGCNEIQIGIESGSDRILKRIKKGLTVDMINEKVPIIRQSGLKWIIFLIIGFPTETEEEIAQTIKLIKTLKPDFADVSVLAPYPGTAIYYELKEQGLLDRDLMKSDMCNPDNNYTGTISDDDFRRIAMNALKFAHGYNNRFRLKYKFERLIKLLALVKRINLFNHKTIKKNSKCLS
jgi:radical SAM superfamily enzyme YgiQ (UPF0313 family)